MHAHSRIRRARIAFSTPPAGSLLRAGNPLRTVHAARRRAYAPAYVFAYVCLHAMHASARRADMPYCCIAVLMRMLGRADMASHAAQYRCRRAGTDMQVPICRYADMQVQICRYRYAGTDMQVPICRYRYAGTDMQVPICRCKSVYSTYTAALRHAFMRTDIHAYDKHIRIRACIHAGRKAFMPHMPCAHIFASSHRRISFACAPMEHAHTCVPALQRRTQHTAYRTRTAHCTRMPAASRLPLHWVRMRAASARSHVCVHERA